MLFPPAGTPIAFFSTFTKKKHLATKVLAQREELRSAREHKS